MNIVVPLPKKVSTNEMYSGMHWAKRKKLADLYHMSLIEHRNTRITDIPVDICFVFRFKGRLLDCDNCMIMGKLLVDSMRQWKILADDSPDYVQSITVYSMKGKRDEVEISIL